MPSQPHRGNDIVQTSNDRERRAHAQNGFGKSASSLLRRQFCGCRMSDLRINICTENRNLRQAANCYTAEMGK